LLAGPIVEPLPAAHPVKTRERFAEYCWTPDLASSGTREQIISGPIALDADSEEASARILDREVHREGTSLSTADWVIPELPDEPLYVGDETIRLAHSRAAAALVLAKETTRNIVRAIKGAVAQLCHVVHIGLQEVPRAARHTLRAGQVRDLANR
jgi:hypothetical protein